MTKEQQAYKNILDFCKGYESTGRENSEDYKDLKKFVEESLEKSQQ